ncbi:tetratricopeptide repeat protein [Candidatus Magnetominusculus xianensis]|uniref:Tetratricopeptide TPR_2 repeat protein n=1 Tax=Candidatus Magnetominusculus xianensis TaxID=1748249 RepID=A0ABR5SGK9_9BACT|nr:tetratricopeptide repeat protein [Candidatus Magnetominusculus xianensis]KWT90148.1 tetratricopeptide TPR_2 repeat protein [Candidatus Magnetominusculus xianensis]MBF0403642.1 tetratricopeptide repeat protein [Nitrospirota bacterium]
MPNYLNYLTAIFLAAAVFIVYIPLNTSDFVSFDDPNYITINSYIKSGLTLNNIMWSFKSTYFANWHPVTWISHMVDITLYDMKPMGHHLSSVCFHAGNTVLLYLLLLLMTGKYGQSAAAAVLFAFHPFAVESVAWVSERKNVLSTFFWLLTIVVYVYYTRRPALIKYAAALMIFALSLMSKPMAVTLPLTLLLVDHWPLGRFQSGQRSVIKVAVKVIVEKIPFFILSLASGIVTILVQQKEGAIVTLESLPFSHRLMNAIMSYWGYLEKTIVPAGFAVFYPHGDVVSGAVTKGLCLLLITVTAFLLRKRAPYLLMGWLWYMLTLVPVIQLIQVGGAAMADRYTYVPLIGIYIMICFGLGGLAGGRPVVQKLAGVMFAAVVVVLAALTWQQAGFWKNSGTLFKHAADVTKGNYVAHNEYGMYLIKEGRLDDAIAEFSKGLEAAPDNTLLNFNMWEALNTKGRKEEAEKYFLKAVPRTTYNTAGPSLFKARGVELMRAKDYNKAVQYFLKALQAAPDDPELYNYLGLLLGAQKKYKAALECFANGLKANPSSHISWELYFHRGLILREMGREAEAEEDFKESLRLNPDSPIVRAMVK